MYKTLSLANLELKDAAKVPNGFSSFRVACDYLRLERDKFIQRQSKYFNGYNDKNKIRYSFVKIFDSCWEIFIQESKVIIRPTISM